MLCEIFRGISSLFLYDLEAIQIFFFLVGASGPQAYTWCALLAFNEIILYKLLNIIFNLNHKMNTYLK